MTKFLKTFDVTTRYTHLPQPKYTVNFSTSAANTMDSKLYVPLSI